MMGTQQANNCRCQSRRLLEWFNVINDVRVRR